MQTVTAPVQIVPEVMTVPESAGKADVIEEEAVLPEKLKEITAPIVGVFYQAASPEAAPFVKVGDIVSKGQVVGIVEAMKLMNEIESEVDGEIAEILVKNGEAVEFGQPLFKGDKEGKDDNFRY